MISQSVKGKYVELFNGPLSASTMPLTANGNAQCAIVLGDLPPNIDKFYCNVWITVATALSTSSHVMFFAKQSDGQLYVVFNSANLSAPTGAKPWFIQYVFDFEPTYGVNTTAAISGAVPTIVDPSGTAYNTTVNGAVVRGQPAPILTESKAVLALVNTGHDTQGYCQAGYTISI